MKISPLKKHLHRGAIILWAAPAFLLGREQGKREARRDGNSMGTTSSGENTPPSEAENATTMPWERGGEECLDPLLHLLRMQEDMNDIAAYFSSAGVEKKELHAIADAAFSLGDHLATERVLSSHHAEVGEELCRAIHSMATGLQELNAMAGLRVRGGTLHGGEDMKYSPELATAYRICLENRLGEMEKLRGELRRILREGHATATENLRAHHRGVSSGDGNGTGGQAPLS